MRKLSKQIAVLEGLKSESSIGNVREILSLAAKVFAAEIMFITMEGERNRKYTSLDGLPLFDEFMKQKHKAEKVAHKLLAKNPDMTFEELVKAVTKRK